MITLFIVSCGKKLGSIHTIIPPPNGDTTSKTTPQKKWIVSTLAGSGTPGDIDADSTQALFGNIYGIVVDNQENVYDMEANFIRKVTPGGTNSSMWAGNLYVEYRDGQDMSAYFNVPANMAMDANGIIYFPDYDMNNAFHMREVTTGADVSTMTLSDNIT